MFVYHLIIIPNLGYNKNKSKSSFLFYILLSILNSVQIKPCEPVFMATFKKCTLRRELLAGYMITTPTTRTYLLFVVLWSKCFRSCRFIIFLYIYWYRNVMVISL